MHLDAWMKKAYPVPAHECEDDDLARVNHSLRKWRHLRPHVLKRYNLIPGMNSLVSAHDGGTFYIDSSTCALCEVHISNNCISCPLCKVLGGRCDETASPDKPSIYGSWVRDRDPEPMIKALEKARRKLMKPKPIAFGWEE